MITKLSNKDLDASFKHAVASERKILHLVLEHINEIETRKLYLEMAYSSLYEYLVNECKYSGSAAMRRISAAQLLRQVPAVADKIQSGVLNLSQIGELSRAIKEKERTGALVSNLQKADLVAVISGKTTAETQKEISRGLDLDIKIPEKTFVQKDESVRLELTLTKTQHQRLMKCRNLVAHELLAENKSTSFADVVDFLVEQYLASKKLNEETLQSSTTTFVEEGSKLKLNKTLTPKTRHEVFQRDKCCQFKDHSTGKICGSTFGLEVDHRQAKWAGGNNAVANLQILCRAHNSYKYKKEANLRLI